MVEFTHHRKYCLFETILYVLKSFPYFQVKNEFNITIVLLDQCKSYKF